MAGPLVKIKTLTRKVGLDVNRQLNYGNVNLEIYKYDSSENDSALILVGTLTTGFNRSVPIDESTGQSSSKLILFTVAYLLDVPTFITDVLGQKNLHVKVGDEVFLVNKIVDPEPNEAQIFKIYCNKRVLKDLHFTNR